MSTPKQNNPIKINWKATILGIQWLVDLVGEITWRLDKIMKTLDDLITDVAAQNTVIKSAETLLKTLADEIRNNANDPAKLQALADSIEGQTTELAQAVQDNTIPPPPTP